MARTKRERSNGSGTLRDATAGPPATPSATEATASASANGYVQSAEPKRSRIATAKLAVGRALTLAPNDPTILFEAGHVFHFAGDDARARDYWSRAAAADPKGKPGDSARRALAMMDVPLTVTNQVTKEPIEESEE